MDTTEIESAVLAYRKYVESDNFHEDRMVRYENEIYEKAVETFNAILTDQSTVQW